MKRILVLLLALSVLSAGILAGCGNKEGDPSDQSAEASAETSEGQPDMRAEKYWNDLCADEAAGLKAASDVLRMGIYENGKETTETPEQGEDNDVRLLFSGKDFTRAVVNAEGYALTLPGGNVTADFSLGSLRSQFRTDDYCLTVTFENQNPYGKQQDGTISADGWKTYMDEWFERQLVNTEYLSKNKIIRTRPLSETEVGGFVVKTYCMQISLASKLEFSRYNIAVLRPKDSYDYFFLLSMKTKDKMLDEFDAIVASFVEFEKKGVPTSGVGSYELKENPDWNEETKAYFRKLVAQTEVDFGAFPEGHEGEYADWLFSDEGIGKPDVYMSYQHEGWYGATADFSESFRRAAKYAGGTGFDDKPVFNLTYQFTESNNAVGGYTPVFDILRGLKDEYLRTLAQAIKEYGHPVLFRLNNEMNTDWTDYCGMMLLNDPDLFVQSWRHLYELFREEGVDNCIWIFNPISTSCPYSNWGDAMCYMPGADYVQMLGLTNYQMNNNLGTPPDSFKQMYTETANKMLPWFENYPWIIGEFACGAGSSGYYDWGSLSYKRTQLGRNAKTQTEWVRGMIECFLNNQKPENAFCKNIKVAIWFSANDYAIMEEGGDYEISNYLQLNEGVADTVALLREFLKRERKE